MILWNVRTEKKLSSSVLRLRQKKALHTSFLQHDTLIITIDTFTLCIELNY